MKRITKPATTGDERVDATDADIFVLGGGAVGAAVTHRLRADGHEVASIDESRAPPDASARRVDPTGVPALHDADLEGASTVIVATASDSRNLLVAQLIRSRFDVNRVLVVANDPGRVDAFVDAGHDPVCATTALADAIVDHA